MMSNVIKRFLPLRSSLNNENTYYYLVNLKPYNTLTQPQIIMPSLDNLIYEKFIPVINNTYTHSHIGYKSWVNFFEKKSDFISGVISQERALDLADIFTSSTEKSLELSITEKFKKLNEIKEIYIDDNNEELTVVKIVIEMEKYNYDLMSKIYNEAEFPIKDLFLDKLMDFKYIPLNISNKGLINIEFDKQIYNRETDEINGSIVHTTERENWCYTY